MKVKERSRDWSGLSAYIDGELTDREKAMLEQRLQEDPQLRDELNQLKITRSMLRSLPIRKVPHSFALTPDMVKNQKKSAWLPLFNYTSAISAVIAIVLLLVQFLPGALSNKSVIQSDQPALEMAMSSELDATQTGNPEIIYWGGPPPMAAVEGKGGGGPENTSMPYYNAPAMPYVAPDQKEAPLAEGAPAADTITEAAPATSIPESQPVTSPDSRVSATDSGETAGKNSTAVEESALAEPEALEVDGQEFSPILGVRPPEEGSEMTFPATTQAQTRTSGFPSPIAMIFLGLAVSTGVIAYYFRRKSR